MENMKFKKGFTLVEAMVLLLAVAIILAAATPLITKKRSGLALKIPHGKYICARNEGADQATNPYLEIEYKNDVVVSNTPVTQCVFEPPTKAAYFLVQAVGGGSGGGGAGVLPTTKQSDYDSGSVDILNPAGTSPTWLSSSDYNAYAGTTTLRCPGVVGGKGGDYTYWESDGADPPTLRLKTHTGGAGASVPGVDSAPYSLYYMPYTTSSSTAYNGTTGDSGSTDSGTATDGTWGQRGFLQIFVYGHLEAECGPPSVAHGGSAATAAGDGVAGAGAFDLAHQSSSYAAQPYLDPSTKDYQEWYEKTTLKYGGGGNAGEFKSAFVPAIKKNLPMEIGRGGDAGTNTTAGGAGGDTYFGGTSCQTALVCAHGASVGGTANNDYPVRLDGSITSISGGNGGQSAFGAFSLLSGISADSGLVNTGNYGQGGQGGGSALTCTIGDTNYVFNGTSITSSAGNCNASPYAQYLTGSGAPQPGNKGAIFITW